LSDAKSKRQQALEIATVLRLKAQDDQNKVSTLLMGCKSVCRYLGNLNQNMWIDEELNGYDTSKFKNFVEQEKEIPNYRNVTSIYFDQFNKRVVFDNLEFAEGISISKIPNAITELETASQLVISNSPSIDGLNKLLVGSGRVITKAIVTDNFIHSVLTGIRNRIFEFLDETIIELEFGGIPEQIFEDLRKEVDSKMINLCPDAIRKLQTSYENASSDDPESWSHVGVSCRRIIEDVANALFPVTTQPSKQIAGHSLTKQDYLNRIVTGLRNKSTSSSTFKLNKSMIEYVDSFLGNINSYSNKGTHSTFSKTDASRCVIYTYLVLGDILTYFIESESVVKVIGTPDDRKEGIQKYKNRKTSPFEELLREAKNEILFISTSHEFVAKYNKKLMRELIENNIKITVMVLRPSSDKIKSKESLFEISNIRPLAKLIREALNELCILKLLLGDKRNNLITKTYDSDVKFSYIVIDPYSEDAIMKVEELQGDNPDNRKSSLAYKKDNYKFFQEHWEEINDIKNDKKYDCKKVQKKVKSLEIR
jgi:hypothetical protein